jgi:NAD+ synthase (glutamine-hydrolysing)
MRVALAQINTTVGDFQLNLAKIRASVARAREAGADIVVLPELAISGYPPMDLLQRTSFLQDQRQALEALLPDARELAIVTGAIVPAADQVSGGILNAAVVLADEEITHVQAKTRLPTYDVFDESRYFEPATERRPWCHQGRQIGLAICEDVWSGDLRGPPRTYPVDPVTEQVQAGAELIIAVAASPWEQGKIAVREAMLTDAVRRHAVPFVFVNLVGGNDELIFDGSSFVVDDSGRPVERLTRFAEDFALTDPFEKGRPAPPLIEDDVELLQRSLVLGVRDYLHKLGLSQAVVALSGGIDSAVTAHLATCALGPGNVLGVLMPGPFSSEHSVSDAEALGQNLGIETRLVRIDAVYKSFLEQFTDLFGAAEDYGLTQENLQARIRGTLLMAVSNRESRIVLATGNKSELSVGYTTLYGDLVGGLAVIGDVLKSDVYRLAHFANRDGERIPINSIQKPPSAELAPGQLDSDALPPYDVLDQILVQAVELGRPLSDITPPAGVDEETVRWVLQEVDRNEYKRRQAPLVLRVSPKAFGTGRRLPIVQRSG